MEPQAEENHKAIAPPKKKVKNKGWAQEPEPIPEVSSPENQKGRYKNVAQMGTKYGVDMNSVLGSGFASSVYLGNRLSDNHPVCVKAVDFLAYGSTNSPMIALIHQ